MMAPQDRSAEPVVDAAAQWLVDVERTVRRALVARNGLDVGSEAASEAIAWALQHPDRVRAMANPAGYLYRVGQTAARRQRRWVHRQPRLSFEPAATDAVAPFDAELFDALTRLKHEQRVAVVLVHCFAYSYREVADLLDVTESAVTNHVHRGLDRLRSMIGAPR